MLSRNQFTILNALRMDDGIDSQRRLVEASHLSLGTVNSTLPGLSLDGLIRGYALTPAGLEALAPYKVDNAIIMAAGLSTRFAPISYEKPKGVLRVNGEVLIERQIRQLEAAGIENITVVVGYMKEEFFYLADLLGVQIAVNPEYATRNNNGTLYLVREQLANTYICSSDNYFSENVFEPYVYEAFYSGVYAEGPTDEYCMLPGSRDIIRKITTGGCDAWYMLGHAYFDRTFSKRFVSILEDIYDLPETKGKLWEDIYSDHVRELPMRLRRWPDGIIHEFDSLDELREFDPEFIENVDSQILDNIVAVLHCSKSDIVHITPIKQGLTNMSFRFVVDGTPYVYRHPGAGTGKIISRKSETFSQKIARKLGIDATFVYEDELHGWKISRYIDDCIPFDYHDAAHVAEAMRIARTLHTCGESSTFSFNIHDKAEGIVEMLSEHSRTSFADFDALHSLIGSVYTDVITDKVEPCLCHNDFYDPNLLVHEDEMYLIDWEYSGMSDYASDLGTFICCSDYTPDEADEVIATYFGREPSRAELRHCIAYVALSGYYWFVWAIYKEACGNTIGPYLYQWYRFAKEYGKRALALYGDAE